MAVFSKKTEHALKTKKNVADARTGSFESLHEYPYAPTIYLYVLFFVLCRWTILPRLRVDLCRQIPWICAAMPPLARASMRTDYTHLIKLNSIDLSMLFELGDNRFDDVFHFVFLFVLPNQWSIWLCGGGSSFNSSRDSCRFVAAPGGQ